jgi:NADPH:quinone reductase-like Zn-dependent oxidoreductase
MKAAVYHAFGAPEVVTIEERSQPSPEKNELLVRIHTAVVSATDAIFRQGKPYIARLGCGLTRPNYAVLGDMLCGEVVETGDEVTRYKVGDRVYGSAGPAFGTHAEFICLPQDGGLARVPEGLTDSEAASLADGGLTALPFLRETANIAAGQRVLINGASGSIGSVAVQVARHVGAEVTGVCSTANQDLVRELGADHVMDYTVEDFAARRDAYDIIFDTVGKRSFAACRGALAPGGIYLSPVLTPGIVFNMLRTSLLGNKRAAITFAGMRDGEKKAADLAYLNELVAQGAIRGVVDSTYPLEDVQAAHHRVDTGHKTGNVIVQIVAAPTS